MTSRHSKFLQTMLRYPAADRNKDAILQVLSSILAEEGKDREPIKALEIGSGSGQHVSHLGQHLPHVQWQPTDVDNRLFHSISAYTDSLRLSNVWPPLALDVSAPVNQWPIPNATKFDLILCCNVIHITPWKCTEGLFKGSGAMLARNGLLVTYGPYACDGVLSPESNLDFDRSLRHHNHEWGVRDVRDLQILAQTNGLALEASHEMPANNKILVFRKS